MKNSICTPEDHRYIVDQFAKLPGVRRRTPGNAWCNDCRKAVPFQITADQITVCEEA